MAVSSHIRALALALKGADGNQSMQAFEKALEGYIRQVIKEVIGDAAVAVAVERALAKHQPKPEPLLVKHRGGWCAVAGNIKPVEGALSVTTLCGYAVILPLGYEQGEPDCPECIESLASQKGKDDGESSR